MTAWTNKNGITYNIRSVKPFLEEELKQTITWPTPPIYKVTQIDPEGKEFNQFFNHTDDTMTEICEPNDPQRITTFNSVDNKPRRWLKECTAEEKRNWIAFKAALIKAEQDFTIRFMIEVIAEGIDLNISKDWAIKYRERFGKNLKDFDIKYGYILREVCASEEDLQELFIEIQKLRNISQDRVNMFAQSFRSNSKR